MPVTPFHLGPALVLKPLLGDRLSLGVFALVQGVIDVESISNILLDRWPVHARLHTLPGALAVAAACALAGKPLCTRVYAWARRRLEAGVPRWFARDVPAWYANEFRPVTWTGALVGAIFGALSHVALDGMMHADMLPLRPWITTNNPLFLEGSFLPIHAACGLLAGLGWLWWRRRPTA